MSVICQIALDTYNKINAHTDALKLEDVEHDAVEHAVIRVAGLPWFPLGLPTQESRKVETFARMVDEIFSNNFTVKDKVIGNISIMTHVSKDELKTVISKILEVSDIKEWQKLWLILKEQPDQLPVVNPTTKERAAYKQLLDYRRVL